jgi:hypothetical protein
MPETEHERWQLGQLQYYVQTMLSEQDKNTLEAKVQHYHTNVTALRDSVLGGIGILITIFLAIASTNIMRAEFIGLVIALAIIGIIVYFIVERIIYYSNIAFYTIKASRLKPILALLVVKECLVLTSLVKDVDFNYMNLFNYIKLVGMAKFELLTQLTSAGENRRLLGEKYHYKSLARTEEESISRALIVYESVKEQLSSDENVKFFDEQISYSFGGETIMEMYARLSAGRNSTEFYEKTSGFTINFPPGWLIEQKKRAARIIVSARPKSEASGTFFTISQLDVNNDLVYPTKSLDEVVKFQLDYMAELEDDTTIIEKSSTQIAGIEAFKIVYSVQFKSLVDVGTKVWIVLNSKAYEIEFKSSNKMKFDQYQTDVVQIINSIHFEAKSSSQS